MIELLAPAGDLERLKIALLYGADAVYIGGVDYSLRANAKNFNLEDIKNACIYAHNLNKRVYVTVNIVPHNSDLDGLEEYLKNLDSVKVDGIIVSDVYIMKLWKKLNLQMELHVSTQASTLNYHTALFYKSLGAKRIVLAREASREDIKIIKDKTKLDLEAFIHGAMCTSFSGRCVMSNFATKRDSNRGGCSQVCRYSFSIDNNEDAFEMMPKDLNMVPYIEDMINIGINSFKVEGRMRSIYYIATVINVYRNIIDKIVNKTITKEYTKYCLDILNRCANRDSTPQFYNGLPGCDEQYYLGRNEISNQDFLALVLDYDAEKKIATIEERNYFKTGDVVEIMAFDKEAKEFIIPTLYDEDGNILEVARHPKQVIKMSCEIPLKRDYIIRLKVFDIHDYL